MKKIGLALTVFVILVLAFFTLSKTKTKQQLITENYSISEIEKITLTPTPNQDITKMTIDQNKTYQVVLKTTAGDITLSLNAKKTPITVNNFITLAKKEFYDNTIFHRVINGFMIQGGDPKGDGTGGPGYKFDDEIFEGEYTRGTLAMANAGPNTNGSQFFIMHQNNSLPKNYVIFGKVIDGLEVVDKIATAPVKPNPRSGENSVPVTPIIIKSIAVTEK